MESLLHQLLGSTFIFVKNTHQKAANSALQLILAAGMGYIESFEVLFKVTLTCQTVENNIKNWLTHCTDYRMVPVLGGSIRCSSPGLVSSPMGLSS